MENFNFLKLKKEEMKNALGGEQAPIYGSDSLGYYYLIDGEYYSCGDFA